MQREDTNSKQDFKNALQVIDNLFHLKQFKSLSQSKIMHLKNEKRFYPKDYYVQMRRLLLHMIYLYYVAYEKKIDFYLYPHFCINKWGVIFRYYSLENSCQKFMELVDHSDFNDNVRKLFIDIWNIKKQEQQEMEKKAEEESDQQFKIQSNKALLKNPWTDFADSFVEIFQESDTAELTPKDILLKLQQTKHMKNNVLIVGILSSTIFPCINFNKIVEKAFRQSYQEEPLIISKIFNQNFETEGIKNFVGCFLRFLKVLDDFKILGITTTMSDKMSQKLPPEETLLTEFILTIGRSWTERESSSQIVEMSMEKNPSSNKSSEHDYSQGNQGKNLGQLKCQFFWSKRIKPRELTFRVTISVTNKICPLYFSEIQNIWLKLSAKWKVILNENKQLSSFNPGLIALSYNPDTYQLSFTQYIKCQPFQNSLSQLIITTDKLIIAAMVMKEAIFYYQKKSLSVQIVQEELILNDGRLDDIALSVCQSIKNYYNLSKQVLDSLEISRNH